MSRVRFCPLLIAVAVLSSCGCVRKHTENETSVFTFEWWVGTLCVIAGIVIGSIGIYLFSKKHLYRGALLGLVGVGGLLTAPGFFTEYARVNNNEFVTTEGSWYTRSVARIKFDDIEEARVNVTESRRRFRTRKSYSLVFKMNEGRGGKISLGELEQAALPEITAQLQRRNIVIQGLDQLPEEMK